MTGRSVSWLAVAAILAVPLLATPSRAQSLNTSVAPHDLYGRCGVATSGFRYRLDMVRELGMFEPPTEAVDDIIAIVVLECRAFDGAGISRVPCPAGSPYDLCLVVGNDGVGNHAGFGVVRTTGVADPLGNYTGCPAGATLERKLGLLLQADRDPRLINGIVTLACGPADGPAGVSEIACPAGPHPYWYCLRTHDDGVGNAVTVGVIRANGPGDPHALYGDCRFDGSSGFRKKTDILRDARRPVKNAVGIHVLACSNDPRGFPLTRTRCERPPEKSPDRFRYCLVGDDARGNPLTVGVITAPIR